jgi:hypothetical protein
VQDSRRGGTSTGARSATDPARKRWPATPGKPAAWTRDSSLRTPATAGGVEQLQRGLEVCGEALLTQACSTDDGWRDLRSTQGRIAGQLTRRSFKPSGDIDENGNPVPVRRHQPQTPQRTRAGRFSLAG